MLRMLTAKKLKGGRVKSVQVGSDGFTVLEIFGALSFIFCAIRDKELSQYSFTPGIGLTY